MIVTNSRPQDTEAKSLKFNAERDKCKCALGAACCCHCCSCTQYYYYYYYFAQVVNCVERRTNLSHCVQTNELTFAVEHMHNTFYHWIRKRCALWAIRRQHTMNGNNKTDTAPPPHTQATLVLLIYNSSRKTCAHVIPHLAISSSTLTQAHTGASRMLGIHGNIRFAYFMLNFYA